MDMNGLEGAPIVCLVDGGNYAVTLSSGVIDIIEYLFEAILF